MQSAGILAGGEGRWPPRRLEAGGLQCRRAGSALQDRLKLAARKICELEFWAPD
jgi:hypothetical protein